MTHLFNPSIAIPAVWEMIERIPAKKKNMAIAGGVVADKYFNQGSRDIDVFLNAKELDRAVKFFDYYRFAPVEKETRTRSFEDDYGRKRTISEPVDSTIESVYKGYLLGYPVEFVVVRTSDTIAEYVQTNFDQSIKSCWFDGKYGYSEAFMRSVITNKISPLRMEDSAYVRAWLSAQKYDMELSPAYELSKHFCAYANKMDQLKNIVSPTTFKKTVEWKEQMFNFDLDMANVILQDVFATHRPGDVKLYTNLVHIAKKDELVRHPLTKESIKIENKENSVYHLLFGTKAENIFNELKTHAELIKKHNEVAFEELRMTAHLCTRLMFITLDCFKEGIVIDEHLRKVKINRFINKLLRCKFLTEKLKADFQELQKIVENRETAVDVQMYFTGSKYALTHISTGTPWTSCQAWRGIGKSPEQNYGLLGNVSGGTMVAYVSHQRSDNNSSAWIARMIIRLGTDGSLLCESITSTQREFQTEEFRKSIMTELRNMGYTVYDGDDVIDCENFVSFPFWSDPYMNVSGYGLGIEAGQIVLQGKPKEAQMMRKEKALEEEGITELRSYLDNKPFAQLVNGATMIDIYQVSEELTAKLQHYADNYYHYVLTLDMKDDRLQQPDMNTHVALRKLNYYEQTDAGFEAGLNYGEEYYFIIQRYSNVVRVPTMPTAPIPNFRGADLDGDGDDPFYVPHNNIHEGDDDLPF